MVWEALVELEARTAPVSSGSDTAGLLGTTVGTTTIGGWAIKPSQASSIPSLSRSV